MGVLAPLYIAGFLAIGVPIVLHLIRRTPQGRQAFSSLMFLAASPPTLTRRSRLTNILLLILRSLALILLAIAFARPFFNWGADEDTQPAIGRRVAVLVDTSASMRRPDLWRQATTQVDRVLREASPGDEIGLYFFNRRVQPGLTFEEWNKADPASRGDLLRGRMAAASPGWEPTRLGDALATAVDLVSETGGGSGGVGGEKGPAGGATERKVVRQIVLVSDLQQGGRIDSLQGHEWPHDVLLVRPDPVKPTQPGNASLEWVKQTAQDTEKPDSRLRVRLTNQADSTHEQFSLAWGNDKGPLPGIPPLSVYVTPGRSQTVRIAWPTEGTPPDRLVLTGDDCDFDNTLFIAAPRVESVRLLYLGDDAATDTGGLRYYVQSALTDSPDRKVEFVARRTNETLSDADLLDARLVVVGGPISNTATDRLRRFLDAGGDVLWILKDAAGGQSLSRLLGDSLDVHEAQARDFALLSRLDMSHPLFAPFADSRFSDFTKIHFWKHRQVKLPQTPAPAQSRTHVLASFDNGDPFLFEETIANATPNGQPGRMLVMTSGWHPLDSQLALSTKFVPLLEGMLRRRDDIAVEAQYAVDNPIALPKAAAAGGGGAVEPTSRAMVLPGGRRIALGSATTFDDTDIPGIYRLSINGQETPIAVNLPADESRTVPFAVEDLEQWGVKMGNQAAPTDLAAQERRLRVAELENRQKLWRWLVLGVLGLLAVETALAGRLARRATTPKAVP